jgi:hypothetical protein
MKPHPHRKRDKKSPESLRKHLISVMRRRLWQAERIGWPALAESFRRDLRAMGVEA